MKRLLVTALITFALLAGMQTSAQAQHGGGFGVSSLYTVNWSRWKTPPGGNGVAGTTQRGCLPHPCWSGEYPTPKMFSAWGCPPINPYGFNPYAYSQGAPGYGLAAYGWPQGQAPLPSAYAPAGGATGQPPLANPLPSSGNSAARGN